MTKLREPSNEFEREGLFTEDGKVAQPLAPIILRVPLSVSLAGRDGEEPDELWWTLPPYEDFLNDATGLRTGQVGRKRSARVPEKDFLDKFLDLANGPVERIERFAEDWGPLVLCKHGLPNTHRPASAPWPPRPPRTFDPEDLGCVPDGWEIDAKDYSESGREPVARWRWFSRQAGSLLRIASQLHKGENALREDWIEVLSSVTSRPIDRFEQVTTSRVRQWQLVVRILELWLEWGNVRPQITMAPRPAEAERPIRGINLGGETLFAAIAIYLLTAITGGSLAICFECLLPFVPSKRASAGRSSFCKKKKCGHKAAVRSASKNYRERKKSVAEMRNRGMTIAAISEELARPRAIVRRWLKAATVAK